MKFIAEVDEMLTKKRPDSQYKAVKIGLNSLVTSNVFAFELDETLIKEKINITYKKLIANLIMEGYSFKIKQA